MSEPDWASLPSVVLFDLYHVLTTADRISVSSVCQRWRDAFYFYPNWRKLHLSTAHCNHEKNIFFTTRGKKMCRALSITYVAEDFSEVSEILKDWTCSQKVTEFQLVGSGEPNVASFSSQFSSTVYPFIENCAHLSSLVLQHFVDMSSLNRVLPKHKSTLSSFGLGALYTTPDGDLTQVEAMSFSGFSQLKTLQLDGMWVTNEAILQLSKHLPSLETLVFSLKEDNKIGNILQQSWDTFSERLPRCEIRVTYHQMGKNIEDTEYSPDILTKAQNITHLRMVYCSREFQEKCVNALMRERSLLHTITSIWSISDRSNRDPFIRHPFVVCAWRFKHLQEMILSGSVFDDYDLIGMARMRMCLCIHIAKEDIAVHEGASFRAINAAELRKLCEELSTIQAKPWEPIDARIFNDPALPPKDREAHALRKILDADLQC